MNAPGSPGGWPDGDPASREAGISLRRYGKVGLYPANPNPHGACPMFTPSPETTPVCGLKPGGMTQAGPGSSTLSDLEAIHGGYR